MQFQVLSSNTRGNKYKRLYHTVHCDVRKYFFCASVVNILNSLSNSVEEVHTVSLCKAHLDKIWYYRDVKFDFTTDLTGIGDSAVRDISGLSFI